MVPLPTAERFTRGEFVVPPELQAAIDLRARVFDAELGYQTMTETADDRRESLGRVLVGDFEINVHG